VPHGGLRLTGRKIIVDTYGLNGLPRRRLLFRQGPQQGGPQRQLHGALCRQKHRGPKLAKQAEVQLAYAIGVAEPVSIMVNTFGTGKVADEAITEGLKKVFSFKPSAMIEQLNLLRPIYKKDRLLRALRSHRKGIHLGTYG
jgi:S-adenosylmethionine synthetase